MDNLLRELAGNVTKLEEKYKALLKGSHVCIKIPDPSQVVNHVKASLCCICLPVL